MRAASLLKLVERLTHESVSDPGFRFAFTLTYPMFCGAAELLELLKQRFHVPLPPNLTPEELARVRALRVDVVQSRVLAALKHWVEEHGADLRGDEELRRAAVAALRSMAHSSRAAATAILRSLESSGEGRRRHRAMPSKVLLKPVLDSRVCGVARVAGSAARADASRAPRR